MSQRLTVVIPAASKDAENAWMQANIDPSGGLNSFQAALTKDGSTISNYWFSATWPDAKASALQAHYGTSAYTDDPNAVLTQLGLTRYSPPL